MKVQHDIIHGMQYNNVFAEWLTRRKISAEILRLFNIHAGTHPSLGECIIIPVYDSEGKFSFNKYRRNPLDDRKPKYLYDKGGSMQLYGLDKISGTKDILWLEGEMDSLVCWSANLEAVTSTGGAMSFKDEWILDLSIGNDKRIYICFDNDATGGEGMAKLWKAFRKAGRYPLVVFLPDRPGVKDVSDYVSAGGDVGELLKTAVLFEDVEDVRSHRSERIAHWQSTWFHDAVIEDAEKNVPAVTAKKDYGDRSRDRLLRAKEYPIGELVKFDSSGKAQCIWHKERTGSMVWYEKTNSVYCFGCGKHGDAIDVYKQLNGVGFKEAVEGLQ